MSSRKPMSRSTAWKKANRERYNEYQKNYMRTYKKMPMENGSVIEIHESDEKIVGYPK